MKFIIFEDEYPSNGKEEHRAIYKMQKFILENEVEYVSHSHTHLISKAKFGKEHAHKMQIILAYKETPSLGENDTNPNASV